MIWHVSVVRYQRLGKLMALTSFFVTETWPCAQCDEAKTVELAASGYEVK